MAYSAVKNVAVYGGGDAAYKKLWRLNSNGTFLQMPLAPGNAYVGVRFGLVVADPVGGNFLVLSGGQLWELNPDGAGTWTQQTGSRAPPAGVGNPAAPHPMICVQLPKHGVVAYIKQTSQSGGTFYLYKHA